jgi:hypothetical protein
MDTPPAASTYTRAPLRHRVRVELHASPAEVWSLVGDHRRLPEYSAGIERVDLAIDGRSRVCHFRASEESAGIALREGIHWERSNVGYASSAEGGNAFGLTDDLSIVTLAAAPRGTVLTWEQYYDHPDLPAMRANFDAGFVDIGERLIVRFGGRVVEHYIDGPLHRGP